MPCSRLLADLPCPIQRVLASNSLLDIAGSYPKRCHPVRVHPDAHSLIRYPHNLRLPGSGYTLDGVEYINIGIIRDVVGTVTFIP